MKRIVIAAILAMATVAPASAQSCPPTHYQCGSGTCCSQ